MKCLSLPFVAMFLAASAVAAQSGLEPDSKSGPGHGGSQRAEDLEIALESLEESYAYPRPVLDWTALGATYRARLESVEDSYAFFLLVEQLVEELHDHHAHLSSNGQDSFRLAPSGLDAWVEFHEGEYRILDVRGGSGAERAGLRGGGVIVEMDGADFAQAVEQRLSPFLDRDSDLARSWAARTLIAGRHRQGEIALTVRDKAGEVHSYGFERGRAPESNGLLSHTTRPDGVEVIRLGNSLGQRDLVAEFDAVMDGVMDAKTLVLDLTNTPSGGDTDVARGLMGRFVAEMTPYQRHEFLERPLNIPRVWIEQVTPRGEKTFGGRLLILVSHWTGSMGEGVTMGLDTLPHSTVIGTPMAGLKGATERFDLPHSGLGIYLPTERLLHVDGYPRESFYPDRPVVPSADSTTSELLQNEVADWLAEEAATEQWLGEIPDWIAESGHALKSVDPAFESTEDLRWLIERTKDVQVLAMGESNHGTSEFFRVRHRLTRFLIENAGFDAVAFEASAPTAVVCDRFIRGEDVTVEDAMAGLSMAVWQVEEMQALLLDLRAMNVGRENPIRFFGVDMQGPGASADHLVAVLTKIDADLGQAWGAPMERFKTLVGQKSEDPDADLKLVMASLDDLEKLWREAEQPFTAKIGAGEYQETRRQMNALRQNVALFQTSDWSKRDAAMAENTLGIFDVMGPDTKVILWAHNGHVFGGPMSFAGSDNLAMGGGIKEALAGRYYSLGLVFNRGTFQATGYDAEGQLVYRRYHFDEAPRGSLASYFARADVSATWLDFRGGGVSEAAGQWLDHGHGARWVGGYNVPNDINRRTRDASSLMTFRPGRAFDGLLYLDQTTAAAPLAKSRIDDTVYGN